MGQCIRPAAKVNEVETPCEAGLYQWLCPACGAAAHSIKHVLFHCPAAEALRLHKDSSWEALSGTDVASQKCPSLLFQHCCGNTIQAAVDCLKRLNTSKWLQQAASKPLMKLARELSAIPILHTLQILKACSSSSAQLAALVTVNEDTGKDNPLSHVTDAIKDDLAEALSKFLKWLVLGLQQPKCSESSKFWELAHNVSECIVLLLEVAEPYQLLLQQVQAQLVQSGKASPYRFEIADSGSTCHACMVLHLQTDAGGREQGHMPQ